MPDGPDPPIDPETAEAIGELIDPLQSATGIGASVGAAIEDAPYPPVRLLGSLLQLNAATMNTALTAAETVPNALAVAAETQEKGAEALLPPPPDQVVSDIREQTAALREAQRRLQRR